MMQKAAPWTLCAALLLSGCTAIATAVAEKVYDDRTTRTQITDTEVHARILKYLTGIDPQLPIDVNTDVWRRRVLFTGALDSPGLRARIADFARADRRTRAVYNHIRIVSRKSKESRRKLREEGSSGTEKVGRLVSDAWISAKIKVRLLTAVDVKSIHYRWQSMMNHVYVIGTARTPAERNLVLRILRATKGVKSVTGHIEVKSF